MISTVTGFVRCRIDVHIFSTAVRGQKAFWQGTGFGGWLKRGLQEANVEEA